MIGQYILIPDNKRGNQIPLKLARKMGIMKPVGEVPEGAEVKPELHKPTWQEAGELLQSQFGVIRHLEYNGKPFILVEMELSEIEGERLEVQKLQSAKKGEKAHFRILTNDEARRILNGEDIFRE